ncbi:RNA-directed DNA polymerase, eukaryota [Tanacetum coccineum]|uniref:RNA-directed DNA polymerase, eukaryota n=1 Tax=Tanacetum coccineum TaxID=301880 RepID=A0ABQ4ZZ93_9ASTR
MTKNMIKLESWIKDVTPDEILMAVWNVENVNLPGPDWAITFEFFLGVIELCLSDFCSAVSCFFDKGCFPRAENSSFIALIPKVLDAKVRTPEDFCHHYFFDCPFYLTTQSAFIANRQILDGPFILNEVLAWCKKKPKQALIFKVDFAKAYDSVRWDFLLDVLHAFGFGPKWCQWICGIFSSNMASILVNGSPTNEFPICCGLKQVITDGFFNGLLINASMSLSHLFYADDAVFLGEWSDENLDNLLKILRCFHLASGLRINIAKSHVLGVGVPLEIVHQGASRIGCEVMKTPFKYLGIMVGDHMSHCSAWSNSIQKVRTRLSKWKFKTLSIGGRLTLLKSVLGAVPIYNLSIYKAPKRVLHDMEMLRSLGVSSFFALNLALLLKWLWRFLSQDNSLWSYVIRAIHGPRLELHSYSTQSVWGVILSEVQLLASVQDSCWGWGQYQVLVRHLDP